MPGSESTKYNEIIVMVDASSSQGQNFAELKSTLRAVGQKILGENGNTKLTLMGFGVAPKLAFSVNSLAELENVLSTVSQSDLYYGRSATNCESAFTFIQSYINNSPDLAKAYIFFSSDGETNMDEEEYDWYAVYQKQMAKNRDAVAETTLYAQYYGLALYEKPLPTTKTVYPELYEELVALQEQLESEKMQKLH